jgi:hypothetical protein
MAEEVRVQNENDVDDALAAARPFLRGVDGARRAVGGLGPLMELVVVL